MKLAYFLFVLGMAAILTFLPGFSYAQNSSQIAISAVVLEQITYTKKGCDISVSTNSKNGYWIIDKSIVVSRF